MPNLRCSKCGIPRETVYRAKYFGLSIGYFSTYEDAEAALRSEPISSIVNWLIALTYQNYEIREKPRSLHIGISSIIEGTGNTSTDPQNDDDDQIHFALSAVRSILISFTTLPELLRVEGHHSIIVTDEEATIPTEEVFYLLQRTKTDNHDGRNILDELKSIVFGGGSKYPGTDTDRSLEDSETDDSATPFVLLWYQELLEESKLSDAQVIDVLRTRLLTLDQIIDRMMATISIAHESGIIPDDLL
jgi:hypothetical protein